MTRPAASKDRFSPLVAEALAKGGWPFRSNRKELLNGWFDRLRLDGLEPFPAAVRALEEFGGLQINDRGPGVSMARSPFRIIPTLVAGEGDLFRFVGAAIGSDLYPLGDYDDMRQILSIARNGRVYIIVDLIRIAGQSIDDALENLILGHMLEVDPAESSI